MQGIWRCFQERLEWAKRRGKRERKKARMPSERDPSTSLTPRGALQRKLHLPADEEAGSSRSWAMKHPVSFQALCGPVPGLTASKAQRQTPPEEGDRQEPWEAKHTEAGG